MKTVVITGSARGFGYSMLELFYKNNFNVVMCDINESELNTAYNKLKNITSKGTILTYKTDITNEFEVQSLINKVIDEVDKIDIWINNAGVNQPNKPIWELDSTVINRLVDIDLKGTIICSKLIFKVMKEQGYGAIYNVEGHGSNDALITGLSIYGTSKRALTYFTKALAKESKTLNTNVLVGRLAPGIMITDFITSANGKKGEIK